MCRLRKRVLNAVLTGAAGLLLAGCAAPMTGSPSLTLLSRDINATSPNVKVLGGFVEETESWRWMAFFLMTGSPAPSAEAMTQRLLEKHNADLLLDAEISTTMVGVPYIYMEMKSTVRGRPAAFVKGGAQ